jgi:23S rRNA (cytidine2498-2'-O)-methyltransferase
MAAASTVSTDPKRPPGPTTKGRGGGFRHVFAVCQVGAERALKAEVAAAHPAWRFAYSRPGLVTWAAGEAGAALDEPLGAVFGRAWGVSLGAAADARAVVELAGDARLGASPLTLHVFARDAGRPDERAPAAENAHAAAVEALEQAVRTEGAARFHGETSPRRGAVVLDVIVPDPDLGDPPWVGAHRHGPGRSAYAGGRPLLRLPDEAPSRAYLKLEEALAWSGFSPRRGEVALEIGSAPGGASHALLARGLTVWGVDPGAMDARILAKPRFHHLRTTLGDVRLEAIPRRIDWLALDVNLAPQVALHGLRRIVAAHRRHLRGVILTLKLNDWRLAAEVPSFLARVKAMGLAEVRATQLGANRQEICVVARGGARR